MTIQANRRSLHNNRPRSGCALGIPRLLTLIFFMSVTCCWGAEAATCSPAVPGLAAWWPGDGSATDLIGTNNGILQAGATANGVGLVGSAFTFDGTNNYVQFPDSPVFHPTHFTLQA